MLSPIYFLLIFSFLFLTCHMSSKSQQKHHSTNIQTNARTSLDPDKLSYEIFSILESKFLFEYDDDQKHLMDFQSINHQRGKVCILSIDGGGGIRNIISTKILSHLETLLKKKSQNPHAKISDYFDVGTGSGFGGIFTSMLFASDDKNRPIFNADDTLKLLTKEGPKIYQRASFLNRVFGKTGTGSASNRLMKAMKELFKDRKTGRFLTLRNTVKPVLIPCYDLSSKAPFLFSRADALQTDSYDFNLWEVCMATSAEPGMFDPVCMDSVDGLTRCVAIDGGVAVSNPTAAAITHVLHNKQEFPHVRGVEDILVLSIGTGGLEGGFEYDKVKEWTAKEWAKPLARISNDGSAELVDQAVAMAYGQCRSGNYVRIQANGTNFARRGVNVDSDPSTSNVKMLSRMADETLKQKNVESVMFSGKRLGDQTNFEKLDWFADQLVLEHQKRSNQIAPTVEATSQNPA